MTTLRNPAQWLLELFNGTNGEPVVTAKSTLGLAAIWYGVNRISGNLSSLPLNTYRKTDGVREVDESHLAFRLLRLRPNEYQHPQAFIQSETARAVLWGNSRSYIYRRGQNTELLPLLPDRTITAMVAGEKWHATMPEKDERVATVPALMEEMRMNPHKCIMLPDKDVLHILGFGDGVAGYSLFQMARQSLSIGIGADSRTSKQMTRGFTGKVMLEAPHESALFRDSQKADEFLTDFKAKHGADGCNDEVGLLRGGVTANVLPMSNRDAEFISQRQFQRQESALWLLLESILGDDSSVSYNSLEQKQLAYWTNCLQTWAKRWEDECSYKLLTADEYFNRRRYIKFNTRPLFRTDMQTTITTFAQAIASRIMNPNEARELLDMNPYPGGDAFENPAITPGETGTGETETETANETTTSTTSTTSTTGTSSTTKGARELSTVEAVQKVYLGVDTMLTADEARRLVNELTDAGLEVPGPEFSGRNASPFAPVANRLQHLIGIEEQRVNSMLKRDATFKDIDEWYEGWCNTLGNAIETMGGARELAQRHCVANLSILKHKPDEVDLTGQAEVLAKEICDEQSSTD